MTEVQKVTSGPALLPIVKNKQPLRTNPFDVESLFPVKTAVKAKPKLEPACVKTVADVSVVTGLSKEFIDRVIKVETLQLKEYRVNGVRTIGVGHNIDADKHYKFGSKITKEQAYQLLASDLNVKQKELKSLVGDAKLKQGQKEALIDLLFHVGYGKLEKSDLIAKIKAGKIDQAVSEFNYVLLDGKVNPNLCKRRIQNMHDYSKGKPSTLVLGAMQAVRNKGVFHFENKKKTATPRQKLDIDMGKKIYLEECNRVINVVKLQLSKSKPIKNEAEKIAEKGFLETIKNWLFN